MTPAENLDDIIGKAGLVREALGDKRALAARIIRAEGMPSADRLALAVALDLLHLKETHASLILAGSTESRRAMRHI
jgi:hypothetical protein